MLLLAHTFSGYKGYNILTLQNYIFLEKKTPKSF